MHLVGYFHNSLMPNFIRIVFDARILVASCRFLIGQLVFVLTIK
jgi:hypothetical protein